MAVIATCAIAFFLVLTLFFFFFLAVPVPASLTCVQAPSQPSQAVVNRYIVVDYRTVRKMKMFFFTFLF